jgi:hypothetical protein
MGMLLQRPLLPTRLLAAAVLCFCVAADCHGQAVLFEDSFDNGISEEWEIVGLEPEDYRVRDGCLEVRVKPVAPGEARPMLYVTLPFSTAGTVTASVEVTVVGDPLRRGELAGLCLTDHGEAEFTVHKTNIDGYSVLSPGEPEFIGRPGEEGDPGKYTVKYWPADPAFGPLRVIVRGDYAYFQAGPSADGKYRTFFHSAIHHAEEGLGFGLVVDGGSGDGERWVRFDNFKVQP